MLKLWLIAMAVVAAVPLVALAVVVSWAVTKSRPLRTKIRAPSRQ